MVNSGSEANDLALRIATTARPGHTHVVVMGGAYHGHTGEGFAHGVRVVGKGFGAHDAVGDGVW